MLTKHVVVRQSIYRLIKCLFTRFGGVAFYISGNSPKCFLIVTPELNNDSEYLRQTGQIVLSDASEMM